MQFMGEDAKITWTARKNNEVRKHSQRPRQLLTKKMEVQRRKEKPQKQKMSQ